MSASGHSRRDWLRATIGPRPIRPESDHSRHESEMARWADFVVKVGGEPGRDRISRPAAG
jgi:hypothetical protein